MTAGVRIYQVPRDPGKADPKVRKSLADWSDYNARKQEFINTHPNATSAEIEKECLRLAHEMGL